MATKLEQKQKELIDYSFGFVKYIPYVIDLMNEITELEKQAEEQEENQDEKPKYDKAYLNECIKKAKPNLSKIKDVDKYMDEIRGVEPVKVMDNDFIEKTQNDVDSAMELAIKKSGKKKPSKGTKEIFNKYCTIINRDFGDYVIRDKKGFIQAMEQYRTEGLREELIKFLDFAEPIYWGENEYSYYRQIIDLYLKQKP